MIKRALHFSGKTMLSCLEIIAGLLFVVAIILSIALWQFSKGPVNVSWVAPYLASAITDGNKNITLRTGSIIAEWPSFRGPLSLGVSDFRLFSGTRRIVDIDSVGIRLSKAALLIGQISPEAIIITQPSIKMIRTSKGEFIFSFLDQSAESSSTQLDPITGKDIQNALFLNNNFLPNSILGVWNNLESFIFKDAQFISEDHISGVTWALDNVDLSVLRTHKSLNADISYSAGAQENINKISKLNILANRQKDKTTNFQIKFSSFDTSLMGRLMSSLSVFSGEDIVLNGSVSGLLDKDFSIVNIDGDISSSQFKDTAFAVSGKRDGNKLPLMFKLKEITLEQVSSLWPEQFKDTNAAEWITRRLSKGIITNLVFTAPFQKNESDEWELISPHATFDYKNLSVNYREPLAPVINGFGNVVIENDTLKIKVDGGQIGSMNLTSGNVTVTNLTNPNPTMILIDANADSPISGILDYIYTEPVSLKDVIGIDPKMVKGTGNANVKLTVPGTDEINMDDVDVAVTGSINNVLLPKIVSGMDITGGPYNIVVDDGEFRFKGAGQIAGRNASFDYKEFLDQKSAPYNFNLIARIDTDKVFRETMGIKISDFVDGVVPTDIEYKEEKDKSAIIDVSSNLTNARVVVSPIGYEKPIGRAGFATAKVYMKGDQVQKIDALNIAIGNDKALGTLQFGKVGNMHDVASGAFSMVQLGDVNNFALNFKQTSPNKFQFDIKGPSVDGRGFIGKKDSGQSSSSTSSIESIVTVETPKLRGGDRADQIIRNARINADINQNGDLRRLDFTGIVGKNDSVSVQIKPNASGLNSLSINTKNAGAFLDAFDIYNNMRGGELNIQAAQISGLGLNDFRGNADIRNFKIVKAPILAKLINAFSLSGLGALLNNEGMDFARMRAEFDWRDSKNGRVINVRNGKTSGSSIGLTFGGVLNQDKDTIDISGTVVPIAGVNKIVSKIPLVGELLTGGKDGGIIAATYAVKGTPEKPDVFVNPLSVLAPGFLRSILFEGGETLPKSPPPKKREMN
jgi:hypothetical protein